MAGGATVAVCVIGLGVVAWRHRVPEMPVIQVQAAIAAINEQDGHRLPRYIGSLETSEQDPSAVKELGSPESSIPDDEQLAAWTRKSLDEYQQLSVNAATERESAAIKALPADAATAAQQIEHLQSALTKNPLWQQAAQDAVPLKDRAAKNQGAIFTKDALEAGRASLAAVAEQQAQARQANHGITDANGAAPQLTRAQAAAWLSEQFSAPPPQMMPDQAQAMSGSPEPSFDGGLLGGMVASAKSVSVGRMLAADPTWQKLPPNVQQQGLALSSLSMTLGMRDGMSRLMAPQTHAATASGVSPFSPWGAAPEASSWLPGVCRLGDLWLLTAPGQESRVPGCRPVQIQVSR